MLIKTANLTGAALDWAAAKCEGLIDSGRVVIYAYRTYDQYGSPLGFSPPCDVYYCNDYRPATDWSQGGPIIEREKIDVMPTFGNQWHSTDVSGHVTRFGPTPLIAAMRCYVASKLGDEVEVPDELFN